MGSSPAEIAFVISPQQQGIEMRLTDRRHGAFFYLACGKQLLNTCLLLSRRPIHNCNLPGATLQWAQASAGHTEWKFAEYAGG